MVQYNDNNVLVTLEILAVIAFSIFMAEFARRLLDKKIQEKKAEMNLQSLGNV